MSRDYSPDVRHVFPEAIRHVERDEPPVEPEAEGRGVGRSGTKEASSRTGSHAEGRNITARPTEPRKTYELRKHAYTLRSSEVHTMAEIGKFRALDTKDLEEFAYARDRRHLEADLTNLGRQGLIIEREIPHSESSARRIVALTKEGRRLLWVTGIIREDQALYYGFAKPREAHHDADLYRLYQRGLERLEKAGGRNPRIVLDAELKKRLYRDLAAENADSREVRDRVACRHGLRVVRGKIPVPDLRIEYEMPDGEPARLDLELATEHYRARNLAEKVRAGFSIYGRRQDAPNLRRVLDREELVAEILQL